ncbi:MAG: hypothetical protein RL885_08250 [Planctomycetota bacterium]
MIDTALWLIRRRLGRELRSLPGLLTVILYSVATLGHAIWGHFYWSIALLTGCWFLGRLIGNVTRDLADEERTPLSRRVLVPVSHLAAWASLFALVSIPYPPLCLIGVIASYDVTILVTIALLGFLSAAGSRIGFTAFLLFSIALFGWNREYRPFWALLVVSVHALWFCTDKTFSLHPWKRLRTALPSMRSIWPLQRVRSVTSKPAPWLAWLWRAFRLSPPLLGIWALWTLLAPIFLLLYREDEAEATAAYVFTSIGGLAVATASGVVAARWALSGAEQSLGSYLRSLPEWPGWWAGASLTGLLTVICCSATLPLWWPTFVAEHLSLHEALTGSIGMGFTMLLLSCNAGILSMAVSLRARSSPAFAIGASLLIIFDTVLLCRWLVSRVRGSSIPDLDLSTDTGWLTGATVLSMAGTTVLSLLIIAIHWRGSSWAHPIRFQRPSQKRLSPGQNRAQPPEREWLIRVNASWIIIPVLLVPLAAFLTSRYREDLVTVHSDREEMIFFVSDALPGPIPVSELRHLFMKHRDAFGELVEVSQSKPEGSWYRPYGLLALLSDRQAAELRSVRMGGINLGRGEQEIWILLWAAPPSRHLWDGSLPRRPCGGLLHFKTPPILAPTSRGQPGVRLIPIEENWSVFTTADPNDPT